MAITLSQSITFLYNMNLPGQYGLPLLLDLKVDMDQPQQIDQWIQYWIQQNDDQHQFKESSSKVKVTATLHVTHPAKNDTPLRELTNYNPLPRKNHQPNKDGWIILYHLDPKRKHSCKKTEASASIVFRTCSVRYFAKDLSNAPSLKLAALIDQGSSLGSKDGRHRSPSRTAYAYHLP